MATLVGDGKTADGIWVRISMAADRFSEKYLMLFLCGLPKTFWCSIRKMKLITIGNTKTDGYYLDSRSWNMQTKLLTWVSWVAKISSHRSGIVELREKPVNILGFMYKCFEGLDKHALSTIFKVLVRSHIEYLESVWSPYYAS